MICSNFSTFFEKRFATEETADERLIFIYVTASMYSIIFDRKHKSILAPENTGNLTRLLRIMSKWGKQRRSDVHKGLSRKIANTFIEFAYSSSIRKLIKPPNIKGIKE